MNADVIGRRYVKLHGRLIVFEKQTLHMIHFWPVRAPVRAGNRNMIPAHSYRCDDEQLRPVDQRRNAKHSAFIISRKSIESSTGSSITINIKEAEIFHAATSSAVVPYSMARALPLAASWSALVMR